MGMKKLLFALFVQLSLYGAPKVAVVVGDPFINNAIVTRLQMDGFGEIRNYSTELRIDFTDFMPDYLILDGYTGSAVDAMVLETKVLAAAHDVGVKKTLLLASTAIYPEKAAIALREESLQELDTDSLKDPYQIAKITAFKQCKTYNGLKQPRYILCPHPMLSGPHDTGFTQTSQHPLKNIASRIVRCKWQKNDFAVIANDGKASYEIMHVDDLAEALLFLLTQELDEQIINIGLGRDTNVKAIAEYVASHLKFREKIIFDPTCFDEVPRRVLDAKRITALGWYPSWSTQDMIKDTVLWLEAQQKEPYKPGQESNLTLP